MKLRGLAWFMLLGASGVMVYLALRFGPELPAEVAIHFGLSGEPDGYGSRGILVGAMLGTGVLMLGLFAGLARWLPRMPDSLINLPHKGYWLAPERRAETLAEMGGSLLWIGAFTQVFLARIFWETIRFNLTGPTPEGGLSIGPALIVYFALVAFLTARLFWRFRRPTARGSD